VKYRSFLLLRMLVLLTASAFGAECIGTFALIYTIFAATDPKRSALEVSPHLGVSTGTRLSFHPRLQLCCIFNKRLMEFLDSNLLRLELSSLIMHSW
jgi:hypothetical protein